MINESIADLNQEHGFQINTVATLHAQLAKIQLGLKAKKSQYNAFGKYSYRKAEDILEAVKPLLCGLTLLCRDDIVFIGSRFYVKATYFLSDGVNEISCYAFAREEETKKGMDGSQITGAASSYARKYALSAMFAIDDNQDADSDEKHSEEPSRSNASKVMSIVGHQDEKARSLYLDRCNQATDKINETTSLDELRTVWENLALDIRSDKDLIGKKNMQKTKLENK